MKYTFSKTSHCLPSRRREMNLVLYLWSFDSIWNVLKQFWSHYLLPQSSLAMECHSRSLPQASMHTLQRYSLSQGYNFWIVAHRSLWKYSNVCFRVYWIVDQRTSICLSLSWCWGWFEICPTLTRDWFYQSLWRMANFTALGQVSLAITWLCDFQCHLINLFLDLIYQFLMGRCEVHLSNSRNSGLLTVCWIYQYPGLPLFGLT